MIGTPQPENKPWLAKAEVCRQIRQLSESRRTRRVAIGVPNRWEPGNVKNPATGEYFDTMSAWDFIHSLLEAGVEVEQMVLKYPPGKKGYVLYGQGCDGRRIYIKLQLMGDWIAGRSFHISDEESREK